MSESECSRAILTRKGARWAIPLDRWTMVEILALKSLTAPSSRSWRKIAITLNTPFRARRGSMSVIAWLLTVDFCRALAPTRSARKSLVKNREWKQARLSFYWVGLRAVPLSACEVLCAYSGPRQFVSQNGMDQRRECNGVGLL